MPSPTIKYGKLFMKDSSGNLVQIMPRTATTVPDYQGATTSANGVAGLVPAAQASQKDKFLRGDGTWQEVQSDPISNYQGATSSESGVAGLVPAALSGDREKYLRGDGTWQEITEGGTPYVLTASDPETDQSGTLDDVNGLIFYVPDLNSSQTPEPTEP